MKFEKEEKLRWKKFEINKVWKNEEYKLINVGKIVIERKNKN
jgi:catalase